MIVDGDHSYGVALEDLKNFKPMANKKHHLVIMDDVPHKTPGPERVWREAISQNIVKEAFCCRLEKRGFAVGQYIF